MVMGRIETLETELASLVHNYAPEDRPRLDEVLADLNTARSDGTRPSLVTEVGIK